MKLKIKVTKKILKNSMYCGRDGHDVCFIGKSCAIALAIIEIFPNAWVSTSDIFNMANMDVIAQLPIKARNFIYDFDRATVEERVKMPELEFEIELTDYALSLINIDEITEALKNSETLELV
jgi:hypothetical protein